MRKLTLITMVFTLMVWGTSLSAYAAGPNFFNPAIYADGDAWATKGVADLPSPNAHNRQSFDKLFSFTNGANGQLPVAEAAPGNPNYNGGRWDLKLATWIMINPPIVTSYEMIEWYFENGNLIITSGNSYFECPLLPLKR